MCVLCECVCVVEGDVHVGERQIENLCVVEKKNVFLGHVFCSVQVRMP